MLFEQTLYLHMTGASARQTFSTPHSGEAEIKENNGKIIGFKLRASVSEQSPHESEVIGTATISSGRNGKPWTVAGVNAKNSELRVGVQFSAFLPAETFDRLFEVALGGSLGLVKIRAKLKAKSKLVHEVLLSDWMFSSVAVDGYVRGDITFMKIYSIRNGSS